MMGNSPYCVCVSVTSVLVCVCKCFDEFAKAEQNHLLTFPTALINVTHIIFIVFRFEFVPTNISYVSFV